MFDYLRMAMREAKKQKECDRQKKRFLSKNMDYQFLEDIIQRVNENPHLNVRITLADHTVLDVNTYARKSFSSVAETNDFEEVR